MIDFLTANWIWIAFIVVMLVMHRHGGCGMHGRHHHDDHDAHEQEPQQLEPGTHAGHQRSTP